MKKRVGMWLGGVVLAAGLWGAAVATRGGAPVAAEPAAAEAEAVLPESAASEQDVYPGAVAAAGFKCKWPRSKCCEPIGGGLCLSSAQCVKPTALCP